MQDAAPLLAEVARPWVLYEVHEQFNTGGRTAGVVTDLQEQLAVDFTIRPSLRRERGGVAPAEELACYLVHLTRFYKQHVMAFRRVACALLDPFGGTRPSPEQRFPNLQRIAEALAKQYDVYTPLEEVGLELRTPLRILVQTSFQHGEGIRSHPTRLKLRPTEKALMFCMLAEAAGIPCAYVFLQTGVDPGYRVQVLSKLAPGDPSTELNTLYDPISNVVQKVPPGGAARVAEQIGVPFTDAVTVPIPLRNEDEEQMPSFASFVGRYIIGLNCPVDGNLAPLVHGTVPPAIAQVQQGSLYDVPEWDLGAVVRAYEKGASKGSKRGRPYPMVDLDWAKSLLNALSEYDPTKLIRPFMLNPIEEGARSWVTENLGPGTTGGIIAGMSRVFSLQYTELFTRLVQWIWETADKTEWFTLLPAATQAYWRGVVDFGRKRRARKDMLVEEIALDISHEGAAHLGFVVGEWVRHEVPYCEETVNIEEITGPLAVLHFILFRRRVHMFDCDDVSLTFMTFMESVALSAAKMYDDFVAKLQRGTPLSEAETLVLAGLEGLQAGMLQPPPIMTAVRLAGDPPSKQIPEPDKYHVYPLLRVGDATYVYDVSNPVVPFLPLNDELPHGGNQETRTPQVPQTWLGLFYEGVDVTSDPAFGMAAGRMVGTRRVNVPPPHVDSVLRRGW